MKKLIILGFTLAALMLLCSCGHKPVPETYCDTLKQAEKLVGISLTAPDSVNGSGTKTFSAKGRTLEIMYFDGKVLTGRISKSDNGENLALDFGYTNVATVSENGSEFSLYGDGDRIYLSHWQSGKYSFSVLLGSGLGEDEMVKFCETIR